MRPSSNAIRWDPDGDGTAGTGNETSYEAAFPAPTTGMGCPATGCKGYEIGTGAPGEGSITIDMTGTTWTSGLADLGAVFEGNGNTIDKLAVTLLSTNTGLFNSITTAGVVRNLGLTNVAINGATRVGALAGSNQGLIINSYAEGSVTGNSQAGGLVGNNGGTGKIRASRSSVAVSRPSAATTMQDIGGLVGDNFGEITASYADGRVSSAGASVTQTRIGGLVGQNRSTGTITASYSVGLVTVGSGATHVGGLVGSNAGTVTASYWNTTTSGRSTSAGGTGRTTTQLQAPTDYTGIYLTWNVDVDDDGEGDRPWRFPPGAYPVLALDLPYVTGVELLSPPASGTFTAGGVIRVRATFNEAVTLTAGNPALTVYSTDGWLRGVASLQATRAEQRAGDDDGLQLRGASAGDSAVDALVVGTHPQRGGGLILDGVTLANDLRRRRRTRW